MSSSAERSRDSPARSGTNGCCLRTAARVLGHCRESIPHELICLEVPLPRHPTDAERFELTAETARLLVQNLEMGRLHRGEIAARLTGAFGGILDAAGI